jgi:transposase
MTLTLENLPCDLDLCHQIVRDLVASLQERDQRIAALLHQLALLRRYQFGRRSEQMDPAQFLLGFAELMQEAEAPLPPPAPPAAQPKPNGHGRKPLPAELPRDRVEHTLPPEDLICKKCGLPLEWIGEEVTEQLDYVPASFVARQHARAKYACKRGCQEMVVTAPLPAQPIEKGLPGPGLLAHVVVSKFADHIPLYRQEGIAARQGVDLSRSTLSDWMDRAAELAGPVVRAMVHEVLTSKVIHTDDTPVRVLDVTLKGRTRTGRLWAYVGDEEHPYVVFDYSPTRERKWPEQFLGDWRGYLQADAFAGYDAMFARDGVIEVACWAHARRKFFDAQGTDRERALGGLEFVRRLYAVEAEADEGRLDAAGRTALRQEKARPILADFRRWLDAQVPSVLPKSPLGDAIGYAIDQWAALNRYLDDGDLDIDNNAAENILRLVALGRKNWLFLGSDEGGHRAAILYSLIATCKRHGVEPFAYLRDLFERVATHPASAIAALFPQNWKAAHEEAQATKSAETAPPAPSPDTS